jgi:hypothetical protein
VGPADRLNNAVNIGGALHVFICTLQCGIWDTPPGTVTVTFTHGAVLPRGQPRHEGRCSSVGTVSGNRCYSATTIVQDLCHSLSCADLQSLCSVTSTVTPLKLIDHVRRPVVSGELSCNFYRSLHC